MTERPPFITGSHAYGIPRGNSDLDLVLRVSPELARSLYLTSLQLGEGEDSSGHDMPHARFGGLDLILCSDDGIYDVWRKATEFLIDKAPVERDKATDYMNKKKARHAREQSQKEEWGPHDYDPAKARLEAKRKFPEAVQRAKDELEQALESTEWPEGSTDTTFENDEVPF